MPCDTILRALQTAAQREREIKEALDQLVASLDAGSVEIIIGADGAVCFSGSTWEDNRRGVTDVCAYNRLSQEDSWAFRQALQRAESLSGYQVDEQTVAAGVHSHDGGRTWSVD